MIKSSRRRAENARGHNLRLLYICAVPNYYRAAIFAFCA